MVDLLIFSVALGGGVAAFALPDLLDLVALDLFGVESAAETWRGAKANERRVPTKNKVRLNCIPKYLPKLSTYAMINNFQARKYFLSSDKINKLRLARSLLCNRCNGIDFVGVDQKHPCHG